MLQKIQSIWQKGKKDLKEQYLIIKYKTSTRTSSIHKNKTKINFSFLKHRQTDKKHIDQKKTYRQKRHTSRNDRKNEGFVKGEEFCFRSCDFYFS